MDTTNKTYLAADIGGTKTLIAIYIFKNKLEKKYLKLYTSKEWKSFDKMLNDFTKNIPKELQFPNYGCIAVAGPIDNGKVTLTNLKWKLDENLIRKAFNMKRLEIINDFSVLLYGLDELSPQQQVTIQKGNVEKCRNSIVTIIGAGTGLGVARGIATDKGIIPLPSEGGHVEFSPRTETEWLIASWLKKEMNINRLSLERIVSGTGLGNIACWRLQFKDSKSHPLIELSKEWQSNLISQNPKNDLPALVSQFALEGDKIMQEVLNVWLSAYGSAAGDIAIHELCEGGLWIGGGTAAKQLKGIKSECFLESMKSKGRFRPFMEKLSVKALIDPEVGLFSAACKAHLIGRSNGTLN